MRLFVYSCAGIYQISTDIGQVLVRQLSFLLLLLRESGYRFLRSLSASSVSCVTTPLRRKGSRAFIPTTFL